MNEGERGEKVIINVPGLMNTPIHKPLAKSNSQNPRTNSQNRKILEKQIKTLTNTINESKHEAEAYLHQLNKDREKISIQK